MRNEVEDFFEPGAVELPTGPSAEPPPPEDYQARLRLIRLQRYLSRRDYEWLETQDPSAAKRRKSWCFRQFIQFCAELQREQRRLSRERSMAQCASVGELFRTETRVTARIAELLLLGSLYFAGIQSDAGRIVREYLGIERLIHPGALAAAPAPALG